VFLYTPLNSQGDRKKWLERANIHTIGVYYTSSVDFVFSANSQANLAPEAHLTPSGFGT